MLLPLTLLIKSQYQASKSDISILRLVHGIWTAVLLFPHNFDQYSLFLGPFLILLSALLQLSMM